eukprot:scaffold44388_cov63-Phaeocystis_antarctica.AAC.8
MVECATWYIHRVAAETATKTHRPDLNTCFSHRHTSALTRAPVAQLWLLWASYGVGKHSPLDVCTLGGVRPLPSCRWLLRAVSSATSATW